MKIQNFFLGDNNIRKAGGSKEPQKVSKPDIPDSDRRLAGAGYVREQSETYAFRVDPEFEPRIELVNSVRERIANDHFDDRYIRSVAERLVELPVVKDVIAEAEMNTNVNNAQENDRIEQVRELVEQGKYDDPAIQRKIAENLISSLGLDFMTGSK